MGRNELIEAIKFVWEHPSRSDWEYEATRYTIIKAVPRVDIRTMVFVDAKGLTTEQIADTALRLEAERADQPARPFVTHEELISDIALLQYEAKWLGSRRLDVLIPLTLECRNAGIAEMVWDTHIDVPAGEVVAEIYRREKAATAEDGGPGWGSI